MGKARGYSEAWPSTVLKRAHPLFFFVFILQLQPPVPGRRDTRDQGPVSKVLLGSTSCTPKAANSRPFSVAWSWVKGMHAIASRRDHRGQWDSSCSGTTRSDLREGCQPKGDFPILRNHPSEKSRSPDERHKAGIPRYRPCTPSFVYRFRARAPAPLGNHLVALTQEPALASPLIR